MSPEQIVERFSVMVGELIASEKAKNERLAIRNAEMIRLLKNGLEITDAVDGSGCVMRGVEPYKTWLAEINAEIARREELIRKHSQPEGIPCSDES